MGTIVAQTVIDRAGKLLYDQTNVHWPALELLDWLNDAQRQIVLLKPESFTKNTSVLMVAGTKQSIPADGVEFRRVVRNMGLNGTTPGRAVRKVDMDIMDIETPDWHTTVADAIAKHYLFDEGDPKRFYLWPQQPVAPHQMEIVYSAAPPSVAAAGNTITMDDIYANPMLDYMLWRARLKDSKNGDINQANNARAVFQESLGMKEQGENKFNPPTYGLPMRQGGERSS